LKYLLLAIVLLLPAIAVCEDTSMSPSIKEAKKKHEARLIALPGVVSVGIGLDQEGNQAIIVGLDRQRPETEARIPQVLENHPVLVQIIGPIRAK
jgi:hypothetical protein